MKKEFGVGLTLLALCAITAFMNPRFLAPANLTNMANVIGLFGMLSIGVGLVIISGGIDLSVGSMCALVGVLLSMALAEWNWPWPLALAGAVIVPMILGSVHGWLVSRLKLQPFIVTLCGLLIYRGLARFIANDSTKGLGAVEGIETLRFLASGRLLRFTDATTGQETFPGVPMPFVLLLLVSALMWVVLHRSVYGRYLFAVGRNEEAARYSGINTRRVEASAYVLSGMLAGLAGVMIAFYTNSVSPSTHGNLYELYGIAAAVLGGCSLRGGEGSILGILLGTALLQVLQNLVNLLGIPSSLNFAVMGGVVLLGAIGDQLLTNRVRRGSGGKG